MGRKKKKRKVEDMCIRFPAILAECGGCDELVAGRIAIDRPDKIGQDAIDKGARV